MGYSKISNFEKQQQHKKLDLSPKIVRLGTNNKNKDLTPLESAKSQDNDIKIKIVPKCDIATQTKYDPEDIQVIFLRRMDQILGSSRIYKPVSQRGIPRLGADAQGEQALRLE